MRFNFKLMYKVTDVNSSSSYMQIINYLLKKAPQLGGGAFF